MEKGMILILYQVPQIILLGPYQWHKNLQSLSLITKSMTYSSDIMCYEMDFLSLQRNLSLESNFVAQRQVLAATIFFMKRPPGFQHVHKSGGRTKWSQRCKLWQVIGASTVRLSCHMRAMRELSQGDAASCATQEATNLNGTAFFGQL